MRDLLACLSTREVHIVDKIFRVRPPSLAEALRITAALEVLHEHPGDTWEAIEQVCRGSDDKRGWLPHDLCDVLFQRSPPAVLLKTIRDLLVVGVPNRKEHEKSKAEVVEEARRRSWFSILADYANAMNTAPSAVLSEPFPLFIALCAEVLRLKAERKADFMIAYSFARTGGDGWEEIMKAAGYMPPPARNRVEWNPDPEWVEAERKKKVHRNTNSTYYGKPGKA